MNNRISQCLVSLVIIVIALQVGMNVAKSIGKAAEVNTALKAR